MLYRNLAPISNEAWSEIDKRAAEVLKTYLSARKAVKVVGPLGPDKNVITDGRLTKIQNMDGVDFGVYKVQPLVESRVEFELDRWELDNLQRGAKDIDYEPLEKAMKEIALFEDKVVYHGLDSAGIEGLEEARTTKDIIFGKSPEDMIDAVLKATIELRKAFVEPPYALIVNEEIYRRIILADTAYPLIKTILKLIGGQIIYSHVVDGGYLLPFNNENIELTLGNDFSIGYQAHTPEKVRFFVTESFAFRVFDPSLIVKLIA